MQLFAIGHAPYSAHRDLCHCLGAELTCSFSSYLVVTLIALLHIILENIFRNNVKNEHIAEAEKP